MVTTVELFEQFFQKIKECDSITDIYKEFGGSSIYVPSYKSVCRNKEILNEYEALIKEGAQGSGIIRRLASKYDLSVSQIYAITKDIREPSLF
ncbi:Mor transcription activator family protein [Sulfurimonas sp. RIFOXYD2_FULL_34_21]|uniref:Mor transcription activator family protein n=1 Tax=Sulfurimonas sp. RIFOXYD2_FULL_34_21 TaxID=1802261 RepID=UPI0008D16A1D|nr:Mor transcription activator family protein [Sulfurimonas sp. RIFOXYD2_FULL_34_21]OHE14120.1 MAG: hypothetical protein A2530_05460 [Sulfurimonas sp. RIFOXYD2_FULL_34_21]